MSYLIAASNSSLGSALVACLILFLVLAAVFWACKYFQVPPVPLKIIGVVLAVIFLLYTLGRFGVMPAVSL